MIGITKQQVFIVLMAMIATFGEGSAQQKDGKSIKEDAPALGTTLKKKLATSTISMDKTYAELDEDEKAQIRSVYDDMPDDDEPPYPLHGTREIHRKMMQVQQIVVAKGRLTMTVDVSSTGEASSVTVYESPDTDITQVAARALMETPFKPAICKGKPCKMQYFFQANFERIL